MVLLLLGHQVEIPNKVKPWFASIIHSRNMLVIQSTCISKQISRPIGSVVIMFGITCYSYCKTSLVYRIKIYQKCLLILWNTHRTSYLQSKVLLYVKLLWGDVWKCCSKPMCQLACQDYCTCMWANQSTKQMSSPIGSQRVRPIVDPVWTQRQMKFCASVYTGIFLSDSFSGKSRFM